MNTELVKNNSLLGLDFFIESDGFIRDLTEEDESLISGGRRRSKGKSPRRRSRSKKRRRKSRSRT